MSAEGEIFIIKVIIIIFNEKIQKKKKVKTCIKKFSWSWYMPMISLQSRPCTLGGPEIIRFLW